MGFNSAFKVLKLLKNPGNVRLNNLNDPVLNVIICCIILSGNKSDTKLPTQFTATMYLQEFQLEV